MSFSYVCVYMIFTELTPYGHTWQTLFHVLFTSVVWHTNFLIITILQIRKIKPHQRLHGKEVEEVKFKPWTLSFRSHFLKIALYDPFGGEHFAGWPVAFAYESKRHTVWGDKKSPL